MPSLLEKFRPHVLLLAVLACQNGEHDPEQILEQNARDLSSLTKTGDTWVLPESGKPFTGPVHGRWNEWYGYGFVAIRGYLKNGFFESLVTNDIVSDITCSKKIGYKGTYIIFRSDFSGVAPGGGPSYRCGSCASWRVGKGTLVGNGKITHEMILSYSDIKPPDFFRLRAPYCQPSWEEVRTKPEYLDALMKISANREEAERILRRVIPLWALR